MLKSIKFGQKVKSPQIERFKGVKDTNAIISIVAKEGIQCASVHFEPGIGTFYCFEGQCCSDCGPARVYYLLPVLVYHVKDWSSFTVDLSQRAEIRVLRLGEEAYNKLITKDSMIDVDKCDILVVTEDEKFQRYNFEVILDRNTAAARPPSWRTNDQFYNSVLAEYRRYGQLIQISIGKDFNPDTYNKAKERAAQNKPTQSAPSTQAPSMPPMPTQFQVEDERHAQVALPLAGVIPSQGVQGVMPTDIPPATTFTQVPPGEEVSDDEVARLLS